MDGTKNIQQMAAGIGILLILVFQVLASLWGLLDVALSRYEDKETSIIGVLSIAPTLLGSFALLILLTPIVQDFLGIHAFDFIPFQLFSRYPVLYFLPLPVVVIFAIYIVTAQRLNKGLAAAMQETTRRLFQSLLIYLLHIISKFFA